MRGEQQRLRVEWEWSWRIAHQTASLVALAVHVPKKFPEFEPPRWKDGAAKAQDAATFTADDAMVRAYFIEMSMRTKH